MKPIERITRDILNEELDEIIYEARKLANSVQRLTSKLKMDDNFARALHQLTIDIDVAISRKIARLGLDKYDDNEDVSGEIQNVSGEIQNVSGNQFE